MTISIKNDVEDDLDSKGLLREKYASIPSESLEGILEEIEIILDRVKNVECTSKNVKKYEEKINDLFFKAKQVIYKINSIVNSLDDVDKMYFKDTKIKLSMLKEEVELIDFDAILDYTITNKKLCGN